MSDRTTTFKASFPDIPPNIPDFDLIRPIGRGGFGQVWLATNRATGALRAVKVILLRRSDGLDAAGREITSIARLEATLRRRHRNLITIHHVGKTDEHLYYVMDPADDISGAAASADSNYRPATLKSRLERGPLSADECVKFAGQLLSGLASLHEAGMVHRDVKPANCLFVDGELKLADFGLLTETGPHVSRVGTEKYMPPDGRMDTRADVYAAGLVIYEMLTGLPADRFPHLGRRASELVDNPRLNSLLRTILRSGQSERDRRFRDASEMSAELSDMRESSASGKRSFARRLLVPLVCVIGVAGVLVAAWQAWPPVGDVPLEPPRVHVNFVTEKPFFDAHILLDGELQTMPDGAPYATPCTIPDLPGRIHEVSFHLEGQKDMDAGRIDFSETRHIVGRWDAKR